MADYQVGVNVSVDDSKLDALENRIKSLNDKSVNIDIKVNDTEVNRAVSSVKKNIQNAGKANQIKLTSDTSGILKEVNKVTQTIKDGVVVSFKTEGLNELDQATTVIEELNAIGEKVVTVKVSDEAVNKMDTLAKKAREVEKINLKTLGNQLGTIDEKSKGLGSYYNNMEKSLGKAATAYSNLQTLMKNDPKNYDNILAAHDKLKISLKEANSEYNRLSVTKKNFDKQQKESINASTLLFNKESFGKDMSVWLKQNSAASVELKSQVRGLMSQLESCNAVKFNDLKQQFSLIKKEAVATEQTGLNFTDRLKVQFTRLAGYFGASSVIMGGIQITRKMMQNVLDVDTQMTELYRVTDLTSSQYSNLYNTLTVSAKEYGVALTDLISATADWSRAGFDADTSAGLAEVTSIYQHISDLDYDEAAENLLTAYKGFENELKEGSYLKGGFGDDAKSAVSYVSDILNELDNNYAVTAAGVGEAMKRSASAMSVAGNTIQETAGMITGITEVTQDPEKAGNALKVVSMRLRGMKGELQELGEDVDDNVENLSKMQGQILEMTNGKVNIFDDYGEFKSTYEILQDIASVWEDLSSTNQAELLETVAGKHRANDVAAIFQNWQHVEDAVKSATSAEGSALKEQEKYADSLQGRLNSLTASFQEFSNTAANSNLLKGIVSFGAGAIDALDAVVEKFGLLPTIATVAATGMSLAGKGFFKVVTDETNHSKTNIKEVVNSIKDSFSVVKEIGMDIFSQNKGIGNFSLDTSFIDGIDNDVEKLKEFRSLVKESPNINIGDGIAQTLDGASDAAREFAKTWDGSTEALAAFEKGQLKAQGVITKSGKSLSDCGRMISAFNNANKSGGDAQQKFLNSISRVNPELGRYLTNLKGSQASLGGYVASMIGARAATIGLQIAVTALNAAMTMGISLLVSAAVEQIMHWINAADELSDKVKDVTQNYENQKESLNNSKKTIDDVSESYKELSKGVNSFTNENISLSTDEYSEYLDIVNQIADTFPSLVTGYDAQGNAILSCVGSVEKLNEAYREAAENNYKDVLDNGNDIFKDFKNKSDKLEPGDFFGDFIFDDDSMRKDTYESLKKVLDENNGSDIASKLDEYIMNNIDAVNEVSQALEDKGIDRKLFQTSFDHVRSALKDNPKLIKEIVSDFESQMDSAVEEMQTAAEAYIGKAFLDGDYSNISDNMENIINSIVPNLGYDYFSQFDKVEELYASLDNMMGSINSLGDEDKKTFETYFDLQSKVNNGECTVGEYIDNLSEVSSVIDGLDVDEETKKALKLSLQLDDNDIKKQYDDFVGQLVDAGKNKTAAKQLASSLNATELKAAVKLEAEGKIDLKKTNLKDIKAAIQKEAKYLEAMDFTIDIDAETDGIDKLNSALAEARSGTGLTAESFDALKSRYKGLEEYDAAKLFQETANGLSLNAEAVNEYEKALAQNKLDETTDNIGVLKDKYYDLTSQIQNCSDATQKAELINEQEDIRQKISDLAELATMYEGLTSSYNEWQNAESAGNDRDMYESIYSAQENIKKELDNGWIDDGTKEYFQLIWGEDKWDGAGKSIQDYRDQWAKLDETISGTSYSISDFFKTNEDGELTSEGIFNFFDAIGEKQKELGTDWIQYDENGDMKSFNFGVDGDKAIADAMGISEELVQIFLRASQDAGFVVNFDGTYTQLADMQSQADAAAAYLKEIGMTKVDFDFNTKDLSSLNSQLEEAKNILADPSLWNQDGTFNFDATGATEAMQVVSTLQATIDNLDNHYIGLTVEDDSFKEPLEKLQDYENKVAYLNQLKLDPKANAEDIEKLEADIQDIVQYIRDNADNLNLDITAETTDEDIMNMIESGEIEIPTTLDIQTNISDTLDDLKDIMLLNSGYLTEDQELELKVKLGIATDDEQIENEKKKAKKSAEEIIESVESSLSGENIELSKSGKDRATKFFKDNEYARSFDKDEQVRTVKFIADWSDIDEGKNKYTDNQIEAVVKFIKDVDDVEKYVNDPIKKQAIIDFVVDNQNVLDELNLDEEKKSVLIDFIVENPDILDGFNDEQKKVAIDFIVDNQNVLDGLDDDQKRVAIEYFVQNPDALDEFDNLSDEEKQIKIQAIISGEEGINQINNDLSQLDDKQVQVIAQTLGNIDVEQLKTSIGQLDDKTVQAIATALGQGDVQGLQNAINGIPDQKVAQAIAQAFGYDSVEQLNGAIGGLDSKTVQAIAQALGIDSVEGLKGVINGLDSKTVQAIAEAIGAGNVTSLQNVINSLTGKTVNVVANLIGEGVKFLTGGGVVDGTARVNGTAFASGTTGKAFRQGDWGTKEDGVALGGELGTELLVRNGRWYTIGENGAEFFGYKKDDIIK